MMKRVRSAWARQNEVHPRDPRE